MTSPIKYHGGKGLLAPWLASLMPPRCTNPNNPDPNDPGWLHYVEPYFGGGSLLFYIDPEGISEVANDINQDLMRLWQVLRDPDQFLQFRRRAEATPFSKTVFEGACRRLGHGHVGLEYAWWERAFDFFVVARQALSGRIEDPSFAAITRNRTRRGMNEQVSAWLTTVDGLREVHHRLRRVLMFDEPAVKIIKQEDGKRTFFYFDPTYLHETRATTTEYGPNEMTPSDHEQLLDAIEEMQGRFMLSGYHSKMYDSRAKKRGWKCHEHQIANSAAGGKSPTQPRAARRSES